MKREAKITEKMTIKKIMEKFPATLSVFSKYGLHCLGCPMSAPETIKEAAQIHGLEIKKFIRELNEVAKQK